jgi:uncharacterized membrane protein
MKTKRILWMSGAVATAALGTYGVLTHVKPGYSGLKVKKSILIDHPESDLYAFWRNLENLPKIAEFLESVTVLDDIHSRWTLMAPGTVWRSNTTFLPVELEPWLRRCLESAPKCISRKRYAALSR